MERMTFRSQQSADVDDDNDQDDDAAVSSLRRLIDVIVTSEHLQYQRNPGDVQSLLPSNGMLEEPALQVSQTSKILSQ